MKAEATTTYFAKVVETIEIPGGWKGSRIGVFRNDGSSVDQIGEYQRNYVGFFDTFFPFRIKGKDVALYSSDYTESRIMALPSCKDLGGEEPHEMGFCPVEYFVPTFIDQEVIQYTNNKSFPKERITKNRINNPTNEQMVESRSSHSYVNGITGQKCDDTVITKPVGSIAFYPFGFVAGCIWADESSWKVQYLDLSAADRGILKRDDRFGYIELPENLPLRRAIDMSQYLYDLNPEDDYANRIRINVIQSFDLRTGKAISRLK